MSNEGSRTSWDSQHHVGSFYHVPHSAIRVVVIYKQGEGEMMGSTGVARALTICENLKTTGKSKQ